MMPRSLYKGEFTYAQVPLTLYTWALDDRKAWLNFTTQIAKKVGRTKREVRFYFSQPVDNYRINKEARK